MVHLAAFLRRGPVLLKCPFGGLHFALVDRLGPGTSPGIHNLRFKGSSVTRDVLLHESSLRPLKPGENLNAVRFDTVKKEMRMQTHVMPIPGSSGGQLLPALDEQHTGVADLARPLLLQDAEAAGKLRLVLLGVREARRRRLSPADAASQGRPVDLGLVEAKHGDRQQLLQLQRATPKHMRSLA